MKIHEIIAYSDFNNLTKCDIDNITEKLEFEVDKDEDIKKYLYDMKNIIYRDEELEKIVVNRVLAGRTSLKWYRLDFDEENREDIIRKLESPDNYFNDKLEVETSHIESIRKYTCLNIDENKYLIRLYVPTGTKRVDNGVTLNKFTTISNTTVIVDLEKSILEVRSSSKFADKIANEICGYLGIINHEGKRILGKYRDSIEKLRDSLDNGKFIDATSIPDQNIELTSEENQLVVETLEALDEYFIDKELDKLINSLNEMDPAGIPFTQLLLAGMSKIGMAVKRNDKDDLSKKSLYNLFKGYMTDYSGFITFSLPGNDDINYTIQVGLKTNTISFRSSVTEDVIDYIKGKIV
ncbi:hypothetical protein DIC82_14830 [Clostridium beijerinckii]|nr:hypothetical protein DIC82_14830 [Clostridium beijerinckii]